jgi:hypothetical protein
MGPTEQHQAGLEHRGTETIHTVSSTSSMSRDAQRGKTLECEIAGAHLGSAAVSRRGGGGSGKVCGSVLGCWSASWAYMQRFSCGVAIEFVPTASLVHGRWRRLQASIDKNEDTVS